MDAEILIKARKVFLKDPVVEFTETCPYCESKGIDNKLRYYYISLEEAIYKCAGARCLYPFERFIFKSLRDNSVYYYEEVPNEREVLFKVTMDGPKQYVSENPLDTTEFSESQRNPNIESYDFDFPDFFDDIGTESDMKSESVPKTTDVNLDCLEFLDEIALPTVHDVNTNQVFDQNGMSNDNLLNESPMKTNIPIKTVKTVKQDSKSVESVEKSKSKTAAKLSKCIEQIEKAKMSRNQKTNEKQTSSFTKTIRKAQNKLKTKPELVSTASPVKTESQIRQATANSEVPKESVSDSVKKNTLTSVLKCPSMLRPTALAKQLSSMNFIKDGSDFLHQYMKNKEDNLFKDEINDSGAISAAKYEQKKKLVHTVVRPTQMQMQLIPKNETITCSTTVENNASTIDIPANNTSEIPLKKTTKARSSRKSVKNVPKEANVTEKMPLKKEPKKRTPKPKIKKEIVEDVDKKNEQPLKIISLNEQSTANSKLIMDSTGLEVEQQMTQTQIQQTLQNEMAHNEMSVINNSSTKLEDESLKPSKKEITIEKDKNVVVAKTERKRRVYKPRVKKTDNQKTEESNNKSSKNVDLKDESIIDATIKENKPSRKRSKSTMKITEDKTDAVQMNQEKQDKKLTDVTFLSNTSMTQATAKSRKNTSTQSSRKRKPKNNSDNVEYEEKLPKRSRCSKSNKANTVKSLSVSAVSSNLTGMESTSDGKNMVQTNVQATDHAINLSFTANKNLTIDSIVTPSIDSDGNFETFTDSGKEETVKRKLIMIERDKSDTIQKAPKRKQNAENDSKEINKVKTGIISIESCSTKRCRKSKSKIEISTSKINIDTTSCHLIKGKRKEQPTTTNYLANDWDDFDEEQSDKCQDLDDTQSVISITSATTDSSIAIID